MIKVFNEILEALKDPLYWAFVLIGTVVMGLLVGN